MNFQNNIKLFNLFLIHMLWSDYYETCTDYVKQENEENFFSLETFSLMVSFFVIAT